MVGNVIPETAWELDRLGVFTSSKIDALLTEPRSKAAKEAGELSETAKEYILSRAGELITGTVRDVYSAGIEWGNTYEPEAAEEVKKRYPDFIYYGKQNPKFFPYTKFSGGSPDGESSNGRIIHEVKCPENPSNHVAYCLMTCADDLKKIERQYYHQIQMNMLCVATERGISFMDMRGLFHSYCPIVTDGFIKLKTLEIYPDENFSSRIDAVLQSSEMMLSEIVDKLREI